MRRFSGLTCSGTRGSRWTKASKDSSTRREEALYGAAVFAVTGLATMCGHDVADYLEQPCWAAQHKQEPGPEGRYALNRHIAGYSLVQGVFTASALRATGLRVPLRAVLAGQVINAATHWIIDRGPALNAFARVTKNTSFYNRNEHGVNGRMLMDQACHKGILAIAAGTTAYFARKMAH